MIGKKKDDAWTPYGLESLRQASIRKRRYRALGIGSVLLLFIFTAVFTTSVQTDTEIFANGERAGSLQLEVPEEDDEPPGPDATISVSPGRVSRLDPDAMEEPEPEGPGDTPARDLGSPVNWVGWVMFLSPFLFLATIMWAGFRGRAGPEEELNYGVYKGAMPLEMITASHAHLVRTTRRQPTSLFGRSSEDYGLDGGESPESHD